MPKKKEKSRESKSSKARDALSKKEKENIRRMHTGSPEFLAEIQELGHVLDGDVALDRPEVIVQGYRHLDDLFATVFH